MISFDEALATILSAAPPVTPQQIPLAESLNRVLAEDVHSDVDMPPFNKSAMDGYACRRADLPGPLCVTETIPAGGVPKHSIEPGTCAKIMTGAMVPEGADSVVMVEHTETVSEGRVRSLKPYTRSNICIRGEDVKAGDRLLGKGTLIAPEHIAVLAGAGCAAPHVAARPHVAVISTGDELVPPTERPGLGRIRDSNGPQLTAQAAAVGAIVQYRGIAEDTELALETTLLEATATHDVIIMSGGVSMGDFDYVPQVLTKHGFRIRFDRVAVKPGRPTTFAVGESAVCFGLPGNPVSTFILFELLVKPFLYLTMGHRFSPPTIGVPLGRRLHRRKTDRDAWLPVCLTEEGLALPVDYHGSAHAHALTQANGLVCMPEGVAEIAEGTPILVRQIR
ncbi:MAG: molybdopterin molybdotransferase MoeA [Lentisphaerae bacterium]|jgi:molybdopterin molybdotransferase|nr:molybdopterin molybdotransferase MoeA [Lentisphaerota bacterium]MBT4820185.1 molybdopterin molybdotransferase MoeA [Lentisphaerota bacterium]MBT5610015.1 molybdopterin molybdotransferase MoeA [Lentisphaerota bacterium]MBT7059138.1 molybdopterin molybdotransferase MoeA [Lentisphaerota bacterium]MBT7841460.1 molybdopterin molybdotransferase MoeA [Lentisphaerota bacterium]